MIEFKQKEFTEYDAMKSLYEKMKKAKFEKRLKFDVINSNSLIPILKGNNVVIERFVISTSLFRKDLYRLYLKVGAKIKMPDNFRLPSKEYDNELPISMKVGFNRAGFLFKQKTNSEIETEPRIKLFGKGGTPPSYSMGLEAYPKLTYRSREINGDVIEYNKKDRSIVLEYKDIDSVINSLNILPFGIDYKLYLLDA